MTQLSGTVVVTGAGSGIGAATAARAAECGAHVVGVDILPPQEYARAIDVTYVEADVSTTEGCATVAKAAQTAGPLRGLFNCAGVEIHGSVTDLDDPTWDRVIAVNLTSVFKMSRALIPLMADAGGGAIVNMSSIQALATQEQVAAYATAKGGVLSLTRAMSLDHGHQGIRVVAVCPGTIGTPLVLGNARHFNPENPGEQLAQWGACTPWVALEHQTKWRSS
jgi:NAD(P)-dependent dehydrogenase (short-subunit alcohol dehydrogenase family)